MKKIDLHIHTNLSDGLLSPSEVAKLSLAENCQMIAITDHEIITEFNSINQIKIIPGIEFNTEVSNLHLLGYGMTNPKIINDEMYTLRKKNESICFEVIELLQKANYDISNEKIIAYLKDINLSYDIIDKRKIVKYLIYKGYAKSTLDAYQKLIGKNTPFYVPNYKKRPEEIIDLIHKSNGISVLAHPTTLKLPLDEQFILIEKLTYLGLDGIEIINNKMHTFENIYDEIATYLGLIKTVGSDFHNPSEDNIGIIVDDKIYDRFNEKIALCKKLKK